MTPLSGGGRMALSGVGRAVGGRRRVAGVETRYDSAGRVQPIEYRNLAQPGTCLLCNRIGRNSDEIFATLNVELEFYGIAYLCLDCCAELADFVMFKSPSHYRSLEVRITELAEENFKLKMQLKEAKGLIDARINSAGSSVDGIDGIAGLSFPDLESLSIRTNQDAD